jgi:hypothetical protein
MYCRTSGAIYKFTMTTPSVTFPTTACSLLLILQEVISLKGDAAMETNPANLNRKGAKPISPANDMKLRQQHEQASGKSSGPRAAANSVAGRESKAMKHAKKK